LNDVRLAVLLLAPVLPFPPDRGGKADVWRRALALRTCGATVLIACPRADENSDRAAVEAAAREGIDLVLFDRVSIGEALTHWLRAVGSGLPLFSARRLPAAAACRQLSARARELGINVVVSEGPWLWPLAKRIGQTLDCPLVYRSHNIEAAYMRRQRELERSWRMRLSMKVNFFGLDRFERQAIANADLLLDISADDLGHWRHPHGRCLPPIPAPAVDPALAERTDGVVFLGNLRAPNNLAGLRMLLDEVLPAVRRKAPELSFHVVGSSPDAQTEQWIRSTGAQLHKDVANPLAWLLGAGCIVNPVRDGSGVQLKTLDMLQTDRPIVTFAQGLRGLPPKVRDTVKVVSSPAELTESILRLHRQGFPPAPGRAQVRELFDGRAFFTMLCEVQK
jgi:hypothetical protein